MSVLTQTNSAEMLEYYLLPLFDHWWYLLRFMFGQFAIAPSPAVIGTFNRKFINIQKVIKFSNNSANELVRVSNRIGRIF
jgi:hypothetical protein